MELMKTQKFLCETFSLEGRGIKKARTWARGRRTKRESPFFTMERRTKSAENYCAM
jgi:hypothetical protein